MEILFNARKWEETREIINFTQLKCQIYWIYNFYCVWLFSACLIYYLKPSQWYTVLLNQHQSNCRAEVMHMFSQIYSLHHWIWVNVFRLAHNFQPIARFNRCISFINIEMKEEIIDFHKNNRLAVFLSERLSICTDRQNVQRKNNTFWRAKYISNIDYTVQIQHYV